jgi:hypothetical protein
MVNLVTGYVEIIVIFYNNFINNLPFIINHYNNAHLFIPRHF